MSRSRPLPATPDGERLTPIRMPEITFPDPVIHHSTPPLPNSWDDIQYQNRPRPRVLSDLNTYRISETPNIESTALDTPIAFPQPYGGGMAGLFAPPRVLSQSRSVGELSKPYRASVPERPGDSGYPSLDKTDVSELEVRNLSFAYAVNAEVSQFRDPAAEKASSALADSKQVFSLVATCLM
jgi:hypothetical protein